jgi:hypothetical protein
MYEADCTRGENLSLTQCPSCHNLSFVDVVSCPNCAQAFPPGQLQKIADAEDRAFKKRAGAMFIILLMISMAIVLAVILQDYLNGTGRAHS